MKISLKRLSEGAITPEPAPRYKSAWHLKSRTSRFIHDNTSDEFELGWALGLPPHAEAYIVTPPIKGLMFSIDTIVQKAQHGKPIKLVVNNLMESEIEVRRGEILALLTVVPAKPIELTEVSKFEAKIVRPQGERALELPEGAPYEVLRVEDTYYVPNLVPHPTKTLTWIITPGQWRQPSGCVITSDAIVANAKAINKPVRRELFNPKTYSPEERKIEDRMFRKEKHHE